MTKRVTFLELPVFSGVTPLVSGYMEAYARKDPRLVEALDFTNLSLKIATPYESILSRLLETRADVYALSCYVWNAGLIRRLVAALQQYQPSAPIILGGPQVIRQGAKYLSPDRPHVVVCNGEGERTFSKFLTALLSAAPDFTTVPNLSFFKEGRLITTEPEPRISDLSEVPSPFLEGLFERDQYTWTLIETNRGCPFKCNYCFWGGATGAKVHRYDDQRLKREIEWISQSGCLFLFIADANWGILQRDVDLSRHIVECRERYGFPLSVYFCSSKNTPGRVAEISQIFHAAGVTATQSVALQTMSTAALKKVNRDNIKTTTYTHLQAALNRERIPSFVELIWPLPGETLVSFEEGLAELCARAADGFLVYPLMLMNNTELTEKRAEYGLVTVPDPDPNSEAEIVIQTSEVSSDDYREGARFAYAVYSLYALRGLWTLGRYLNAQGVLGYRQLFRRFLALTDAKPDHPWTRFCEQSIREYQHAQYSNIGELVHRILHAEREVFDALLEEFVVREGALSDPLATLLFEIDLVARPYVYADTPITHKARRFTQLEVLEILKDGYRVAVPARYVDRLPSYVPEANGASQFTISHRKGQLPFMPKKGLLENYVYCQAMSDRISAITPDWHAEVSREGAPYA